MLNKRLSDKVLSARGVQKPSHKRSKHLHRGQARIKPSFFNFITGMPAVVYRAIKGELNQYLLSLRLDDKHNTRMLTYVSNNQLDNANRTVMSDAFIENEEGKTAFSELLIQIALNPYSLEQIELFKNILKSATQAQLNQPLGAVLNITASTEYAPENNIEIMYKNNVLHLLADLLVSNESLPLVNQFAIRVLAGHLIHAGVDLEQENEMKKTPCDSLFGTPHQDKMWWFMNDMASAINLESIISMSSLLLDKNAPWALYIEENIEELMPLFENMMNSSDVEAIYTILGEIDVFTEEMVEYLSKNGDFVGELKNLLSGLTRYSDGATSGIKVEEVTEEELTTDPLVFSSINQAEDCNDNASHRDISSVEMSQRFKFS